MTVVRCDVTNCRNNSGGYCQVITLDISMMDNGFVVCDDYEAIEE